MIVVHASKLGSRLGPSLSDIKSLMSLTALIMAFVVIHESSPCREDMASAAAAWREAQQAMLAAAAVAAHPGHLQLLAQILTRLLRRVCF